VANSKNPKTRRKKPGVELSPVELDPLQTIAAAVGRPDYRKVFDEPAVDEHSISPLLDAETVAQQMLGQLPSVVEQVLNRVLPDILNKYLQALPLQFAESRSAADSTPIDSLQATLQIEMDSLLQFNWEDDPPAEYRDNRRLAKRMWDAAGGDGASLALTGFDLYFVIARFISSTIFTLAGWQFPVLEPSGVSVGQGNTSSRMADKTKLRPETPRTPATNTMADIRALLGPELEPSCLLAAFVQPERVREYADTLDRSYKQFEGAGQRYMLGRFAGRTVAEVSAAFGEPPAKTQRLVEQFARSLEPEPVLH
jgi:hypothetical protein